MFGEPEFIEYALGWLIEVPAVLEQRRLFSAPKSLVAAGPWTLLVMSYLTTPHTVEIRARALLLRAESIIASIAIVLMVAALVLRSEERRVGKSVDLGGRRIIKKKTYIK